MINKSKAVNLTTQHFHLLNRFISAALINITFDKELNIQSGLDGGMLGLSFWPRRLACAMRSLAIVITIVRSSFCHTRPIGE